MLETDRKITKNQFLSLNNSSEDEEIEFFNQKELFDSSSSKNTEDRSNSPSDKSDNCITINQVKKSLNREELDLSSNNITLNTNKSPIRPRKIGRHILGQQKTKTPIKQKSVFEVDKIKKMPTLPVKEIRKDNFGTIINKKNKRKVKIAFNIPLEDVEYIESYKSYNVVHGLPKTDILIKQRDSCQCQSCQIW